MTAKKQKPMTKKALKALKASIVHWEENVAADTPCGASTDGSSCALCVAFICANCPINKGSPRWGCTGTPYAAADFAWMDWNDNPTSTKHKRAFRRAARKEVAFLKSLLPEGER